MLLAELHGVLRRDKFRQSLSPEEVEAYVTELTSRSEPQVDPVDPPSVSPDRDDDYLSRSHEQRKPTHSSPATRT